MGSDLLFKRFFLLIVILLCCVVVDFSFAQVTNDSYFVKSNTNTSTGKDSVILTSVVLQNTLYPKTEAESAYCDFVIRCNEDGVLSSRLLYFAYQNALAAERNQRFLKFQKILELICKREKINLNYEKSKIPNNKKNFILFNIPKPTFLRFNQKYTEAGMGGRLRP
jgi:hypothetical protein